MGSTCSAWSRRGSIKAGEWRMASSEWGSRVLPHSLFAIPYSLLPVQYFLDRRIRDARARPTIEPAVHEPDQQKHEHAGEDHIGEKMRAGGHAQRSGGRTEGERSTVSERAPLRRRHRGRRQRPERAGGFAGHERAVLRAVAARI